MKIDMLYALINRQGTMTWNEVLQASRHHAQLADNLGFDRMWLGEHHFDHDGTDASPNPLMLAVDLAARTKNIRFGMAALSITLWHPIRVAEDVALADHMSDGRLDIAFGRGILPIEVLNLNPQAGRWEGSEDTSLAIFDENYEIVTKMWTEQPFSHKGKRYELPTPGTRFIHAPGAPEPQGWVDEQGDLVAFDMYPKPLQNAHPPLFAVTESERGFRDAARKGIGAITWYPTGKVLDNLNAAYQEEYEKTHGRKLPLGANTSLLRMAYVAQTDEEARRVMEPAIVDFFKFIVAVRGVYVFLDAHEDPNDPRWKDLDGSAAYDFLLERDHLLIGSVKSVKERMLRMTEAHQVQNWLLQMGIPGIPNNDIVDESMKLFAEEIMPAVREAGRNLPNSDIHGRNDAETVAPR